MKKFLSQIDYKSDQKYVKDYWKLKYSHWNDIELLQESTRNSSNKLTKALYRDNLDRIANVCVTV